MSFQILQSGKQNKTIARGIRYPLIVQYNAFIEALTAVVLRHDVFLKPDKLPVIILPVRGSFIDRNLWIESTILEDGIVTTQAFNMGDSRLMIKKGESVSFLVCF